MFFKNRRENVEVKRRKSYYGFSSSYPGSSPKNRYVIGESKAVKRRELARKIIIASFILIIFTVAFVITDICLNISGRPF